MRQIKLGLIGAGERGANCYAPYALKYPAEVKFVCAAEPLDERRNVFSDMHQIPQKDRFTDWKELLEKNYELDGIIIATQDRQHYEPALAAIARGYNLLLEKPMAESAEKTRDIIMAAEKKGTLVMVCHVLRHTPFFRAMKQVIDEGKIGAVQSIHHIENIGYWHFAHSYVRGSWRNSEETTPMIVAKCSHDTDIMNYLLGGKKCKKISSFGSLSYFRPENAPNGATERCEHCPHNKTCMYSAYKYLEDRKLRKNFRDIIKRTDDNDAFLKYLLTTPYARCVYHCDNNVPDHQVVNMEYEDGITASWQASAFTMDITRQTKIMGTRGEIEGCLEDNRFVVKDFATGNEKTVQVNTPNTLHSGGDECIMETFTNALRNPEEENLMYSARLSLQGHEMAFAAEKSRINGGKLIQIGI
ncbi:Gfo/Idh/MocA family protein [Faecalicatena contorta]|uniref:Gfo/Idh/MocA family protein n=1 Tax=Faecalicatena contorta TaxID=39482 RepID=UPI00189BAEEA|nr:Gfo/Idh/MocA family oxidoreductase [Faecalicatena contorta]